MTEEPTAREELEAEIWAAFPDARPAQVDEVLGAADWYAEQLAITRRPYHVAEGPTASLLAAERRRVLEQELRNRR